MTERCKHALLLSGGQSLRMGTDKAALKIDGETQLDRTAALLQAHLASVCVSVRAEQANDSLRSRYPRLPDIHDNIGPLAGIHAALSEFSVPWLVVACDLPRLDSPTVQYLLDSHRMDVPATAYASRHDGLPEPLCAIWNPAAMPLIEAAIEEKRYCPRKILINADLDLLELKTPAALDNANTPADLAQITGTSTL